jgi:putative addiction module component (TIGR02574 family)
MVIEQHPSLHALSPEDKLQLSEELCMDAMLDVQRNPALRERVQKRLEEYRADPDNGLSWDELKRRILSRQKIA